MALRIPKCHYGRQLEPKGESKEAKMNNTEKLVLLLSFLGGCITVYFMG